MAAQTKVTVAVVGGGISGLVAANRLQQLGYQNVTVFDTGKNNCGGRCASRRIQIDKNQYSFDHGAQYFTVSNRRFSPVVDFLRKKKAIQDWKGKIVRISKSRGIEVVTGQKWTGAGPQGMASIGETLASTCNVRRPVWIGSVTWNALSCKWTVDKYGSYDFLVIAHNGKCADKLMADAGAPAIHRLLQVQFTPLVRPRVSKMQLCSVWVLLVAFKKPLAFDFEGAFVEDNSPLSWIANNTKKMPEENGGPLECWSVFSSREFGSEYKVPQEHVPPKIASEVAEKLLESLKNLHRKLCGAATFPEVAFTKMQLWGAANSINVMNTKDECVFQGSTQAGITGDWLVSPCIEGAVISGLAVAERIDKFVKSGRRVNCDTSLNPEFVPVATAAIGMFPRQPNNELLIN